MFIIGDIIVLKEALRFMNDFNNALSSTKKPITKTKVAFWLLIVPYIIFIVCAFVVWFGGEYLDISTEIQFVALVFLFLYQFYAAGFTIVSVVLQIISLCKGEEKYKNTLLLIFSTLNLLFIFFYHIIFESQFEDIMRWE